MMKRALHVTVFAVGALLLGAAFSLIGTKPVAAAVAAAVQVVNTAANPVPVTGSVNAAVSGNVDLAPGATVKVANTTEPLVVQTTDSKELVQGNGFCSFTTGFCTVNFVTVPAGKRLVITHLSGTVFETPDQDLSIAQIVQGFQGTTGFSYPIEYLHPTLSGSPNGGKLLSYSDQTEVIYGPGQIVQLQVYTDYSGAGGYAQVFYSGYLEPVS
jgi:hypothetical protein